MSDVRERIAEFQEMIETALDHRQSQMHTSLPVKIIKYDHEKQVVEMQPTIKATVRNPDGKIERIEYPVIKDVPVHFMGGGGVTMTVPIKEGDEGIALFSARSIDQWHQSGGVQQQTSARMHDLSDGMYVPGLRSQPRKLKNVSKDAIQLRSDDEDATTSITLDPSAKTITHKVGKGENAVTYTHGENGIAYKLPTGKSLTVNGKRIDDKHQHENVATGTDKSGFPVSLFLLYAGPWALIAYDLVLRVLGAMA